MIHSPHDVWRDARRRMIQHHLFARGIKDRRVLSAMAAVPRHEFVLEHLYDASYDDRPLQAGHGQTISQPYMVALMTRAAGLHRRARVLEIGTGTGYHTAVLAVLASWVWTVERIPELSRQAMERLAALHVRNVTPVVGDGAEGYLFGAPYDAVVVTAAVPNIPPALLDQLAPGGRLVAPLGDRAEQDLVVYERTPSGLTHRRLGACRFVPLISPHAFTA